MNSVSDDEALMLAYVAGDEAAFDRLFERYSPVVLRLGRRHLGNEDDALELLQQTFLRMHGARRDYIAGQRLHPWLMTIVMNLVRDQWRRRRRRPTSSLDHEPASADPGGARAVEQHERIDQLYRALRALPPNQREVIELHWFQEQPYAQVAAILDIAEGTARVRAHRAYGRLKQLLVEKKEPHEPS